MGGTAVQRQRHHAFIRSLWRRGRGGDSILGIVGNSALLRIRHTIRSVHCVVVKVRREADFCSPLWETEGKAPVRPLEKLPPLSLHTTSPAMARARHVVLVLSPSPVFFVPRRLLFQFLDRKNCCLQEHSEGIPGWGVIGLYYRTTSPSRQSGKRAPISIWRSGSDFGLKTLSPRSSARLPGEDDNTRLRWKMKMKSSENCQLLVFG